MSYFFLVTLGCFRNEVESDCLRSALREMKHFEVDSPMGADFIIVNTCGFISEACDEGIDTILKIEELISGKEKKPPIIVAGCMAQRYGVELMHEMHEVSAVVGVNWSNNLELAISTVLNGRRYLENPGLPLLTDIERSVDTSGAAPLYIRISDGCDRRCNFCAIPNIRGKYASRNTNEILDEVRRFTSEKEREVVLVAQDLTSYGKDTGGETNLVDLIRNLSGIENVHWIRLLYLQPEGLTEELLEEVVGNPKVCRYFDIPFQHASAKVINNMGRSGDAGSYIKTVEAIRSILPEASIRTTVMVGFPGEGEKEFDELCSFVETVKFDWLGVFCYSPEEGTKAAGFKDQPPHDIAVKRYNKILEIQDTIEELKSGALLGKVMEVVVESECTEGEYDLTGRSFREAPVVDGTIYIANRSNIKVDIGDFVQVKVTGREGLDIAGEILKADI